MKKIKNILNKLFGVEKHQILSKYSITDSIQRLFEQTESYSFGIWKKLGIKMIQKGNLIKLYWYKLFVRNSFNRIFSGKFIEQKGDIILKGNFSTYLFVKIFMSIWLGGVILFFLSTLIIMIISSDVSFMSWLPFGGISLLLLSFAYFLLNFCFMLSAKGEKEILNLLTKTLKTNS